MRMYIVASISNFGRPLNPKQAVRQFNFRVKNVENNEYKAFKSKKRILDLTGSNCRTTSKGQYS